MNDTAVGAAIGDKTLVQNIVREVAGVFDTPAHLQAAVDHLATDGVDRAVISVLGVQPLGSCGDDTTPGSVLGISDEPSTPTAAFVFDTSWNEARGVATAVPLVIGGTPRFRPINEQPSTN